MKGVTLQCFILVWLLRTHVAVHVAFVMPPASPTGSMLPVVHGCLDAGHTVTLFAYAETVVKLGNLVPKANFVDLGPSQRPQMDGRKMSFILGMPYTFMPFFAETVFLLLIDNIVGFSMARAMLPELRRLRPDVLCTCNVMSSAYSAGEAAGVPVVGLGFGPQLWMTVLEPPWSLEPALGSWYTREEIEADTMLVAINTAARVWASMLRLLATVLHNVRRLQFGLPSFQADIFESMFASPLVVPSLPELSGGASAASSALPVMAGMYDHPALGGASLAPSPQHTEIMAWLDDKLERGVDVVYAAFGSEVTMDRGRLSQFMDAFAAANMTVLWALKKPPADLGAPSHVFVTPWAPQKAVLLHPAVKTFLSQNGYG